MEGEKLKMSGFNRELVIKLILDGISPELAVAAGKQSDARVTWIVEPAGSLGDIPDPSCVAGHLRGIANPTHGDIEQALDLCTRR
jgi:hypothetical protein